MQKHTNNTGHSIDDDIEVLDELLLGVIKIEKKHLYGKDQTSTKTRRDEIYKYLTKHIVGGGK